MSIPIGYSDDFPELPEDEFLKTEQELRREIKRLERLATKTEKWHISEIAGLRAQIRDLLEKNMELSETCNLFAKGLENLKREYIVTEIHHWTRKGSRGLKERLLDFIAEGKRIKTVTPVYTDPQGHMVEAIIVTEHRTKIKPPPTKLFKE